MFSRKYVSTSLAIFGNPPRVKASAAQQETKQKTTQNWRPKPLKSLKTDSEMAPADLVVAGTERVAL
jgi:hypothetical protein